MRTLMLSPLRLLAMFALLLGLVGASPGDALAQGEDRDSLTFELELRGDVPEDERFGIFYEIVPFRGGGGGAGLLLCGFEPGDPSYSDGGEVPPELPECESGQTYRYASNPRVGLGYEYRFFRFPSGSDLSISSPDAEIFHEGTATVGEDSVVRAFYDFGGESDTQQTPKLPNTGAGGTAPLGLPLGGESAAPIALAAVLGLAVRGKKRAETGEATVA